MKNLVFNLRTAKAQAEGCAKVTKSSRMAKILTTLTLLLTLCVGQVWGDNGYWDTGTWQIWVWPGTGSDTWMGTYNKSATANWGVITTSSYYIKGVGANTWGSGVTSTELWWSLNGKTYGGTIGTGSTSGNYYWEKKDLTDVDIVAKAANNPGNNTITCYFKLNGSDNFTSYINFTLPGFTTTSTSQTFDNTTVGSNSSKTISFGNHYGTALTTSNCALSGTNSSEFEVTSINETSVTVKFKPSTAGSKSATLTITDAHSKTCTIELSGKTQYTVTYSKGTYGTGSNQTANKVYGTNLTLLGAGSFTRSGYIQTAWNTDASGTGGTSYALGGTYSAESAVTLYPTWTAITVSATVSPTSGTVGSNSLTFSITSNVSTTGGYYVAVYNFGTSDYTAGYINGDKAYNSSPVSYTGSPNFASEGTWYTRVVVLKDAAILATSDKISFLVASATYSVTVASANATMGSVSPSSINASESSWSSDITATPNAGYQFVNWTSSGGGITISGSTSNPTQIKATSTGGTLTANFSAATYRVTLDNQSATTAGTTDVDATYNTTTLTSIAKPAKTNYTFGGYYTATGGGGVQIIDANGNWLASKSGFTDGSKKSIITENKILYAKWTETTYAVTVAVDDASHTTGNIDCSATGWVAGTSGTAQIGNVTNVTITAGAAAPGYKFDGGYWTLTGGVTLVSGDLTSPSITVKATATGSATFTYAEDLSTTWYIDGDADNGSNNSPFSGWGTSGTRMYKKTGYSTVEKYYCTITVNTTATGNGWGFKAYNSAGADDNHRYYAYSARSFTVDNNSSTIYTNNGADNMSFLPYLTGDYEFEVDNTGANPVLTITWPVINQVRISAASPTDETNTDNFNLSAAVDNVRSKTLSLNANTTYTFKIVSNSDWYGYTSGTFTRSTSTSSNSRTLSTSGGDMTLTTDYAGDYTFKFNESTKVLSIDFPTAYQITWGVGTVPGNKDPITCKKYGTETAVVSNSTWIKSGDKVTFYAGNNDADKVVKDGYTWRGYYGDVDGATSQLSSQTGYSPVINAANMSFYACFYENDYYITPYINGQGSVSPAAGQNGHIATKVSFTAAEGVGYKFDGWTQRSGALTIESPSNKTTNVNATAASVLQANFSPRWAIVGTGAIGGWSDYTQVLDNYAVVSTKDVGYREITLLPNTEYEFKVFDKEGNAWYGYASGSNTENHIYYANSNTEKAVTTATGNRNLHLHSAAGGTYIFKWNLTDKKVAVEYPTSWFMTIGKNINVAGDVTAEDGEGNTITNGQAIQNNGSITFTADPATGYNFDSWHSNTTCTSAYVHNGTTVVINDAAKTLTLNSVTANKTVYAKFVPKTYTVTLTQTGAASSGTANVTATYNATMPSIASLPTAAQGYAFMGYYSAAAGAGTQFTDGSGNWVENIDDYIEDGKWIYDDDVELFAYFKKAEITAITFDAATVETSGTVSFAVTVAPTPVGTTRLCFTVLHSNDNPLENQPTITYDGGTGKYSFTASETSGTYKVEATLRTGSSCDGGTELDTEVASFQVAGLHTVTVQYKCGSTTIKSSGTVTGRPLDWSDEMTAPDIFGYTFSSWTAGDGVTLTDDDGTTTKTSTTEATIKIKAIYDGSLTANYTQNAIIYFKNTLGWSDVYVNFLGDWGYWDSKGSGNENVTNRNKHMTQIDDTDIWYYDYGSVSISPTLYVSFTSATQENAKNFWANPEVNVVYPANYPDAINTDKSSENGFKAATPMFVPLASQSAVILNASGSGKAKYYNAGYWTKYTPGTGYTLEIYNSAGSVLLKSVEFTSEDDLMPMKAVVDLEAGQTYKYQLRRGGESSAGIYYGNSGTMTYSDHGQGTPWAMTNSPSFSMCGITTNAAGDYTFHLSYSANASTEYRLRMAVDYPIASGDYRVIYKDAVHTGWKESAIITQANDAKDTVSFFIRPGSSPAMKIQQATVNPSTGAISWSAGTDISSSLSGLTKDSVYNICLKMDGEGAISVENVEVYTGNFYIRTDAANSKWDNYRSDPDHLMTYSEYSITHGGYSHYYCHWVTIEDAKRKNVKFTIANDYSPCISDTLTRETASGEWANIESFIDEHGNLLRSANVRFMWDQHTNTIRRAYLDPAKGDDNFLVLASADSKIANASEVVQTAVVFSDNENWIYEANVKAKANAQIKLVATWGDAPTTIVQYFKGSADETETLITGDNEDTNWYDIRLIYDYKANRLIAALLPSGNIDNPKPINADVMFIREHQGDISQVTFTDDGALTDIKIAYGVLRFNKWTLNNKEKTGSHSPLAEPKSIYERAMYFISFPFEVNLSEVFGFGTYGQDWIVEYYDGAERARTGWWEGKPGFWRYVWDRKNFVLEPNVGYLLELELGNFKEGSGFWNNDNERLELFFPSSGDLGSITNTTVNCSIPEHACTIDRHATEGLPDTGDPRTSYNRTIFDSHWNVMPVPTYVNATPNEWNNTTWTAKIGPKFLYTWNMDDNTLTATSGADYRYHAMHAYMVQYGGNVQWVTSASPAAIVARNTYAEEPKEVEFRLEIQQNEKMIDQTFIALSNDETVSADFQFGEDMSKDFNARNANIFTKIGTTFAAGNTMPMTDQKTIVPVGVVVKKTGDYTFSIPDGTDGIGVTLIDEETGIRTSLSALDYTVELAAGDYTERFWLEISPVKGAETGIDPGVDARENGVRKVMIDGLLYIVKDGKMYDARGARVE